MPTMKRTNRTKIKSIRNAYNHCIFVGRIELFVDNRDSMCAPSGFRFFIGHDMELKPEISYIDPKSYIDSTFEYHGLSSFIFTDTTPDIEKTLCIYMIGDCDSSGMDIADRSSFMIEHEVNIDETAIDKHIHLTVNVRNRPSIEYSKYVV